MAFSWLTNYQDQIDYPRSSERPKTISRRHCVLWNVPGKWDASPSYGNWFYQCLFQSSTGSHRCFKSLQCSHQCWAVIRNRNRALVVVRVIVSHGSQKIKGPSYGMVIPWFFKIGKKKKEKKLVRKIVGFLSVLSWKSQVLQDVFFWK